MKTTRSIYLHQKNPVSFSYARNRLSKPNFESFVDARRTEETPDLIHEDRSAYLHFVKNGNYQISDQHCYTFCSAADIKKSYFQFDQIYHYLMKHLCLNFFDLKNQSSDCSVRCIPSSIRSVTSTFYPEDSLEMNDDDYYEVWFKELNQPLYFGLNSRLYDDNGNQKSLLDIIYRNPKRSVLGLNSQHGLRSFHIAKIKNVNREEEPITELDTPFYCYQVESESHEKLPVLVNHILVDLD